MAARKLASWLKSSSCVPVVSKVRLRSESLALGLLDDASTEGRIRGCLTSEAGRSAGDRGVEAFSVSTSVGLNFLPGEEDELMMTGRRKGESRVCGRQVAESVDPTFDGEVEDEVDINYVYKIDFCGGLSSRSMMRTAWVDGAVVFSTLYS